MRIGWMRALRVALALAVPAGMMAACDSTGYGYDVPAYVIGHYTCVNPSSGQLDYCVEYSDGTSSLVPWSVYSTVLYGQLLTVSHSVWTVHATSYVRPGYGAPDVYHVRYHAARVYPSVLSAQRAVTVRAARASGVTYGGMSYRNKNGQVAYRSPTGRTYSSSAVSRGTSAYRSSGSSSRGRR